MKAGAKERRGGFTLIELLLVISIILLLITILAVAVHPNTGPAAALQRMNSLSAALEAWRNVYGYYPPSNNLSGFAKDSAPPYGAQCLYYYLMGPVVNGVPQGWSPNTTPAVSAEFTWQGAMNVSADWVTTPPANLGLGNASYFNDGIQGGDRAILYYRAAWQVGQSANGTPTPLPAQTLATTTNSIGLYNYYRYNDNCDHNSDYKGDSPLWPGAGPNSPGTTKNPQGFTKQQQWENEVTDWFKTQNSYTDPNLDDRTSIPTNQRYPQRPMTYLLISAGTDREFGLPSDISRGWDTDDIQNY